MDPSAVISLLLTLICGYCLGKLFERAGRPGWLVIIPIINIGVVVDMSGRAWWWGLLLAVPVVNVVAYFLIVIDFARVFGRSTLFGILLAILPFPMLPILLWVNPTYQRAEVTIP
jgi:hypothetical protein